MSDKERPGLLSSAKRGDDIDQSIRPLQLGEFIGQRQAQDNLRVFIEAAKSRGDALDHVLFVGPPGLGKTTLAQIVAREMGVNFRSTSGPVIAKAGDLAAQLTNLEERDVLFIDEIHRLNPAVEEILYPAMEDYQLDLIIGEGPAARSVKIDLPKFTLVGATTRRGPADHAAARPVRHPDPPQLLHGRGIAAIVARGARVLGVGMAEDGANEIAKRSRGTPRIAGRLLRRVRDFAIVDGADKITRQVADKALTLLDVDAIGLDVMDRRYLTTVAEKFGGGPVGIETIAASLSEPRDAIEDIIEPYLLQQGFIQRTPRGRLLTGRRFRHLGLPEPRDAAQFGLFADEESEFRSAAALKKASSDAIHDAVEGFTDAHDGHLDDELLAKAKSYTGLTETSALMREALEGLGRARGRPSLPASAAATEAEAPPRRRSA